jgi:hypothetical protein
MTLRCQCGGVVEIQDGSDPDPEATMFWERYECVECGRTGTYTHYTEPGRSDDYGGCLTSTLSGVSP